MAEPVIIDTTVIQVKSTTKDNYGNLIVTPTEGKEVKINEKRSNLFDIFQAGRAVKLFWAEYMHKKYIARAELFDGKPPVEKRVEEITTGKDMEPSPKAPERKSSPETGMWWGQMGEMLRCGDIDKNTPQGKAIRAAYYTEMFHVLGMVFDKSVKSKLVQEAKRLGAEEEEDLSF